MTGEDNWQTKLQTVVERTTFMFNNELLSDVKFVVPVSNGEGERKMVIPAHKFVLAISCPLFFTMFYSQMAETKDSVELPDCNYESLLELFRFLYTDRVNLTGSNVMQVFCLANKYMVSSLAQKCAEYLRDNLKASNVFCILPYARKLKDKHLADRCWNVIEMQTEEAVTSDEFVTVERSVLKSVVKRRTLKVKEVELFKAADHWATKECERQGVIPVGEMKRQILGEDIVKAIRFPLISQKEFVSAVIDSQILTLDEVGTMMKHYCGVLKSPLPFKKTGRGKLFHLRSNRFQKFSSGCYYSKADSIKFTVSKPIMLRGVQYFGSKHGKHTVFTEVNDTVQNSCLGKESGTYHSKKDAWNNYHGFDVLFESALCLEANKQYTLVSVFKGLISWYGLEGQTTVESGGVQFTFSESNCDFNNTSVTRGQFPALIFS